MSTAVNIELPGLDCGICGYRTCEELRQQLPARPDLLRRCIHLSQDTVAATPAAGPAAAPTVAQPARDSGLPIVDRGRRGPRPEQLPWHDSLGREFDFYLEHFPEEPGPREIIIPHNPMITREMDITVGDIMIGRPLGMSCGCPITHCGVAMEVDRRTGVIVWCVTGPLAPRQHGYKDLGYYIAEGYEGLVHEYRSELKVGARYYFQPRMCMLQWRHSGLVNYLNRTGKSYQVRLEGLWIG
ncbi:MAG: (Fe-S)-binding protein [Thermoguttaceae bacterium]